MSNLDKAVSDLKEACIEYETGNKEELLYKIASIANIIIFLALEFFGFRQKEEENASYESIKS